MYIFKYVFDDRRIAGLSVAGNDFSIQLHHVQSVDFHQLQRSADCEGKMSYTLYLCTEVIICCYSRLKGLILQGWAKDC